MHENVLNAPFSKQKNLTAHNPAIHDEVAPKNAQKNLSQAKRTDWEICMLRRSKTGKKVCLENKENIVRVTEEVGCYGTALTS